MVNKRCGYQENILNPRHIFHAANPRSSREQKNSFRCLRCCSFLLMTFPPLLCGSSLVQTWASVSARCMDINNIQPICVHSIQGNVKIAHPLCDSTQRRSSAVDNNKLNIATGAFLNSNLESNWKTEITFFVVDVFFVICMRLLGPNGKLMPTFALFVF